ncbi:MAG: hypothetical protein QW404_00400 [Candidatus Nanoarchaeia archaeon]
MKKVLALVLGICLLATAALAADPSWVGTGWGNCNTAGNYGGWDKVSPCKVSWEPGLCDEASRDATFIVGEADKTTTKITIQHLDGIADDSFEIKDAQNNVLCSYQDVGSTETWKTLNCDVNLQGVQTLTMHPTQGPWYGCGTWGQVAVSDVTYTAYSGQEIPEFSAIAAGLALAGAATGFILLRRRK